MIYFGSKKFTQWRFPKEDDGRMVKNGKNGIWEISDKGRKEIKQKHS